MDDTNDTAGWRKYRRGIAARPDTRQVRKIRFTSEEWTTIVARAADCGTPPARYVRKTALGAVPRVRRLQANAELIRQLARIGNNLNQLAYVANDLGRVGEEAHFHAVLDEVIATIKRVE
ncbi:MAG: MobC family plasmid mobilization relaxosome protein [Gemmatimonadota bacterium]|nr:MobC family plasmid mobilization relaxosome protein [Gemmatimonadota bacterium]